MRHMMLTKGNNFLEKVTTARTKVAKLGAPHLPDGSVSLNFYILQTTNQACYNISLLDLYRNFLSTQDRVPY